ncbi:defective in Cullin neddylation protein 1 [Suillus plorans]|uniref:Defective in cullin neddylation protein n=1 Tax=Suillus plorans TaxID=116603 RepID=A0A9P7DCH9_9AGAM|nr:defective in Cullin neddylation protein 1 [Suillus plorans]KAG1787267.1 defective in Cullin neddylation protein 1 [Suillus plorans]
MLFYQTFAPSQAHREFPIDRAVGPRVIDLLRLRSPKDAKRYLDKHQRRLDAAIDAYYQEGGGRTTVASTSKLNALFEKYKGEPPLNTHVCTDPNGDEISIDGTIQLCQDLKVDPENVVLLAVAYELKSPRVGEWNKKGWVEGWSRLGCDTIDGMKDTLTRLRAKLGSDSNYFHKVYDHTFSFARTEGQRSLAIDTALAFWNLLLPTGLTGGALKHELTGEDIDMDGEGSFGWTDEHTQWWFQFLTEKGGKGVSKDTWMMLFDFIRAIDSQFLTHDAEAAWPSAIDDFVAWARATEKVPPPEAT